MISRKPHLDSSVLHTVTHVLIRVSGIFQVKIYIKNMSMRCSELIDRTIIYLMQ